MLQKLCVVEQFGHLQALLQTVTQELDVVLVPAGHDPQSAEKKLQEG